MCGGSGGSKGGGGGLQIEEGGVAGSSVYSKGNRRAGVLQRGEGATLITEEGGKRTGRQKFDNVFKAIDAAKSYVKG